MFSLIILFNKPIIGAINGSCSCFIRDNNIGYVVQSGDGAALANTISGLNTKELRMIGKHSKEIYFAKYKKFAFIDVLIKELKKTN